MTGPSIARFRDLFEPPQRKRPIHPAELAYAALVGIITFLPITYI